MIGKRHFSKSRLAVIISFYSSLFLVYRLGNIGAIFRDALMNTFDFPLIFIELDIILFMTIIAKVL